MTHVFHDAEFMSAREKELVLADWLWFLRKGLRYSDFTDRLYRHLILHCSLIAHYSRAGFYTTYFEQGDDTARFLSQFDVRGDCYSVEFGGRLWIEGAYRDLNRAMIQDGADTIPRLIDQAQARQREADLTYARALYEKHGLG